MAQLWNIWMVAFLCYYVSAKNPMENDGLFEGDIDGIDPYVLTDRNAVVDVAKLWPSGVVYYEIDPKLSGINNVILEAFQEYETKTCLRFRPKAGSTEDYIYFTITSGCSSPVGRKGGKQNLSLDTGCHGKHTIVHEIGHALGLWHEQSRSDRDDYLDILWDNIPENYTHAFLKLDPWANNLLGEEFDYVSVMLYSEYAFAKDPRYRTMKPKKEGAVLAPNKKGLSATDERKVNKLYECNGEKRPPPPDVPAFICDFEVDMCNLTNHKDNKRQNTEWKIEKGSLGGRTGSYLSVNPPKGPYRTIRLSTPSFESYGRKKACFSFDVYFNEAGFVSLDIVVRSTSTKLAMKHVKQSDRWQTVVIDIDVGGYTKITLDAQNGNSKGNGVIALDNIRYQYRGCD